MKEFEKLCEVVPLENGNLIICQSYMALKTADGILHPADTDEYGQY